MELEHFVAAQDACWDRVLAELRAGRKVTHWMWFVFPQVAGLGRSETAQRYALPGLRAARAYLAHPVLGPRLGAAIAAACGSPEDDAVRLFGPLDAQKFHACLTLFRAAADDPGPFAAGLDRFFGGQGHARSLDLLGL